jgi:exosortase
MFRCKSRSTIPGYLAVVGLFVGLIYYPVFLDLFHVWSSDPDYGHGYLVLPISLYLIWRDRKNLLSLEVSSWRLGWIIMIFWSVMFYIGTIGRIDTITFLSMFLYITGAVSVTIGKRGLLSLLFPIFFLIFMFPIPSEIYTRITNPLMLVSTIASSNILEALNLPILRDGNIITLPNYTMKVVQACSGIRSLISIMALSLLMGYLLIKSNFSRIILATLAVPIAIIGNIFRIVATALIAFYISPQLAEGFSHELAGIIVFVLAIILLYICFEILLWSKKIKI